ncbi:MAG: GNAT family N-acetyltransferase [Chloroflexota bacterium]
MDLVICECSPYDKQAQPLLSALSDTLFQITGNDGRASFSDDDVQTARAVFLVATIDGEPVGCGGLRSISGDVCEIKRMYAKYPGRGIGREILHRLEGYARVYGYKQIWLETRLVNENAVRFYLQQGYRVRENYGKYAGRSEAICFEKTLDF